MTKIYSRILGFANQKHSKAKAQKCPGEGRKAKSSCSKVYILEKDQSAFLALGLVQMVWRMDARRSGHVQRSGYENILFLVLLR